MQQVDVICVLVPGFTPSTVAVEAFVARLIELKGISSRAAPVTVLFQYIRLAFQTDSRISA